MDICFILTNQNDEYHGRSKHIWDIIDNFRHNGWNPVIYKNRRPSEAAYNPIDTPKPVVAIFQNECNLVVSLKAAKLNGSAFCIVVTDNIPNLTRIISDFNETKVFLMVDKVGLYQYMDSEQQDGWQLVPKEASIPSGAMSILIGASAAAASTVKRLMWEAIDPCTMHSLDEGPSRARIEHEHCVIADSPDSWGTKEFVSSIATIVYTMSYKYRSIGLVIDDTISQAFNSEIEFIRSWFDFTSNKFWNSLHRLLVVSPTSTMNDIRREIGDMVVFGDCDLIVNASRRVGSKFSHEIFGTSLKTSCDTIDITSSNDKHASMIMNMLKRSDDNSFLAYACQKDIGWTDLWTYATVAPEIIDNLAGRCKIGSLLMYKNRDIIESIPHMLKKLILKGVEKSNGNGNET